MGCLSQSGGCTFSALINQVVGLLGTLVPILLTLAMIVFFWGLVRYIYAAGNEKQVLNGRELITWGLAAIFVMSCIWGILALFKADIFGNLQ